MNGTYARTVEKYEWDQWFRHHKFILTRGIHYHCSSSSFAQQLRNAAVKRGLSISLVERESSFVVTVNRVTDVIHRDRSR